MSFYQTIRPVIFRLQPEQAHALIIVVLRIAGGLKPIRWWLKHIFTAPTISRPVETFGLKFPNAIGLAAGYDKDAVAFNGLACLGFGHIEVGTVTPLAQPGNPRPRLFRLVEDQAVINRMGFNNQGAAAMIKRLKKRKTDDWILGVNIGKNKITPNHKAVNDYQILVRQLAAFADYLVVNVSSPNTPGLQDLQSPEALHGILTAVVAERNEQCKNLAKKLPLLVKLSPDLTISQLAESLQVGVDCGIDGVIVTNTSVKRAGLLSPKSREIGGLSGAPVREQSLTILKETVRLLKGAIPVVASGGVMTSQDVAERMNAGAVLVQLYSGLIYHGPGLIKDCLNR